MKIKFKPLAISIALPLLVGGLSGFLTSTSSNIFTQLIQPPLSPPPQLFGIVWPILYFLMGLSSYLIFTSNAEKAKKEKPLKLYAFQLFVNFFWSIIFFRLEMFLGAFVWLILLWLLILFLISSAYKISKSAAYLLVPYLIWVTFAGYLNFAIYLLN